MTSDKSDKRKNHRGWDHWEHLIETTHDPIAIVDSDFVVLHFNQSFGALLPGFNSGGKFRDIIIPEHQENWDNCLRRSSVASVVSAQLAVRAGELIRWLAVRVLPVVDGDTPSKFIVVCIDVTDAMNFEAELRKREAVLQKAEQLGGLASWTWNVQEDQGYWSDNLYRMIGIEPQSLTINQDSFLQVIHPDDRENIEKAHQAALAVEATARSRDYHAEFRLLKADGTFAVVYTHVEVEHDSAGFATKMSGVLLDITERQNVQEELRISNERLQFALENAGDGLWDWNPQTDEAFFSGRWKSMLGYEDQDIRSRGEEWSNRVHPEDLPQCYLELDKHFKGEVPFYHCEHRIRCKDGSYKWILARGRVIAREANGNPIRVVGTHTDTTDRRRAEQALKESEALLDAAGRMAKVGGWELDAQTREISWTKETFRIHELPVDQKPPLEDAINFYHPEDRPKLASALENAIHHGTPFDLELRFSTATGRELFTRVICNPISEDGSVVRLVGTFQDITEIKQMEMELLAANEKLLQERQRLEESNITLRIVLSQIQDETNLIKQQISQNMERIVKPNLVKLRTSMGERGRHQIDALEAALAQVTSPFISEIEKEFVNLTPREMEICFHVMNGLRSKEIADQLNISDQTVAKFRQKIRKKLKIGGTSANLSSFLRARSSKLKRQGEGEPPQL